MLTEERLRELLDALRGNGDEALTSLEYDELITGVRDFGTKIAELDATIENLTDENTRLRQINEDLMLRRPNAVTHITEQTTVETVVEETAPSDEDVTKAFEMFD